MNGKTLYFRLLAVLLLAGGCSAYETRTEDAPARNKIEITLSNIHPDLLVKATERGDDAYNENVVSNVDCFFYPTGQTGSNAVFSALGRGAEAVQEGDSTVYKVTIFFSDIDAERLFPGGTNACEVYAICNAPLTYNLSQSSVAQLRELVVENDFAAQTVQGSFVMRSKAPSSVTIDRSGSAIKGAGRIEVFRLAAKMQLFLQIPTTYEDSQNRLWEPMLSSGVQVQLVNAVKRDKIDGDYAVQSGDYISYGTRMMTVIPTENRIAGHEDYTYGHVPFYSYSSEWRDLSDYAASFVFRIAWRRVQTGDTETDAEWRSYQISPNSQSTKLEPNICYRTFVAVHSLGGVDKDHEVVIPEANYEIIPWMNESASVAGEGEVPGQLTTYKYLVIDMPEVVLNNENTAYFNYVTSSPITSIRVTRIEYYDNSAATPLQSYTPSAAAGNITAETGTITVSHRVGTANVNDEFIIDRTTSGLITISHSLADVYSAWKIYATVTNGDGATQDIVVEQNPSISLIRIAEAGNIFVNGWFARLTTVPPGTGWNSNNYRFTDNTSGASGTFYHNGRNTLWSTTYNRIQNSTTTINGHTCGSYGTILGSAANLAASIDKNFYTTEITVTSFNSENDFYYANGDKVYYRIGDPRVPSSVTYNGAASWASESNFYAYVYHNNSTTEVAASWSDPENILITSQAVAHRNILAPRLLVSSALNANTGLTFEEAVKRGATYQEAGYPAGRWRLPSEAEIAFIVARQKEGVIPALYATDSDYWSGSGRLVYIPTDANASITFSDPAAGTTQSCRFVYDLWYWGDEPAATNVYHPNGHNTDY